MEYVITGANGQLGQELQRLLRRHKLSFDAADREQCDCSDARSVANYFRERHPRVVFHCAAYTAVDQAEDVGRQDNWQINALGTQYIAQAAAQCGAILVYVSTDYVFDGTAIEPYDETATTNPCNAYGEAKCYGEQQVAGLLSKHYIVRTSWVYGQHGRHFVGTMQRLAKQRQTLQVVADQVGRPTWTKTLAEFMLYCVTQQLPYGTYHLANRGSCSWYEFARAILADEAVTVLPITSAEYPQKAKRPAYSVLSLKKTEQTGFDIPHWRTALQAFLTEEEEPL